MFSATSLLTTLTLALFVAANPITVRDPLVRVPFARRVNETSMTEVLRQDQARAAALRALGEGRNSEQRRDGGSGISVTNQAVTYVASVKVGDQEKPFSLLIDTGSSNTWVGADQKYTSKTSQKTSAKVSVSYGSGSFSGREVIDSVDLGGGMVIKKQSLGVATEAQGFQGVDGILGVGPVDLTANTLSTGESIPTVTDNLASAGTISDNLLAVSYKPTSSQSDANGELTFGATDSSKFKGDISYVPITSKSPASQFWGIDQSITYGDSKVMDTTAGIVDTGTTLVLIASDALQKYQKATGAQSDSTTGLLKLPTSKFSKLQNLDFHIGDQTFTLTPDAQTWPRALNSMIGGDDDSIYLIVGDMGTESGQGLDFINGFAFLERYYSVYDTGKHRVGFAPAPWATQAVNNPSLQ